jgi:AcrR family transcriptional regulator
VRVARKRSLDEGPVLRTRIIECASVLFYERGYGETSIRDIAELVGISSSTMYHHFTNKQEVLHAIVARFMTDFVAATVPVLVDPALTPTERVSRAVRLHIEISDARRPELLVGNPIRYALDPDQRAQGIALQARYHDAFRDAIKDGCRMGEFEVCDIEIATMAVLDMLNGIREWFSRRGPLTRTELVDRYTELVLTLLGAKAPHDRASTTR